MDKKEQKSCATETKTKSKLAEREEEILSFWQKNKIFQKSLEKESPKGEYVFYDGPPFATGLPHYGHLLAGTMKDYIGRYQTMRGKHVPRKWGWDCHGLPVENIVEKDLGLKSKKDIEDYGIEKFNDLARSKVFTYVDDWKKIVPRMGRFVDMNSDYKTMDASYMESVWNVFKTLSDKGLVYEGFKSMHLCPHCGTTLSNFEVAQGYKDITDISVTVKFELTEEPGTFLLAWTTTPWTLPGNVALAVGEKIDYVKFTVKNFPKTPDGTYITSKRDFDNYLPMIEAEKAKNPNIEISLLKELKGKDIVGKEYKPVFDYFDNEKLKNRENGFKVYPASFVTTEDGTGIVHIAPAFGEDDMNLGKEMELPFIQHVNTSGEFTSEVTDFAGKKVKPIDAPQSADIEVIKFLAGKNTLFAKEKFTHSYPHCWRCDTPLLNYATSSWFVEVTKIREDLIRANSEIKWVPKEIGEGRFGKWLESARDWAISRSRFWGTPLPVWKCTNKECKEKAFVGSIEDIKKKTTNNNKFYVVRHGEAESNALGIISCNIKTPHHLTDAGREQAKEVSAKLKDKKIDLIFCSPFLRTKETAEIITEGLGFDKSKIIFDDRLHEVNVGFMDGRTDAEYQAYFGSREEKFWKIPEGGESHTDVKNRMTDFVYDIDSKYQGKNILIVSHNTPIWLMFGGVAGMLPKDIIAVRESGKPFVKNGEVMEMPFAPIPHNRKYELDLHRPFIDELELNCTCGGKMKRIPEVFDCWFESGSMPYGQKHYPFENLDNFNPEKEIGFPADFIAEGVDQTRGWFYSMLVIATALFGKSSYKNVVVNGIVLAEDGQKMSKRLQNYPDPMDLVTQYGADAMRYYLLSSPVMKAEDLAFSVKGVDEIVKKLIMRLQNVFTFYEMYGKNTTSVIPEKSGIQSDNILDKWVLARLKEIATSVTKDTDKYELDRATRPLADFVDELSTWYIRRSRDRYKSDDASDRDSAIQTTRTVLLAFSKLLAPPMPFLAEDLYLKLGGEKESVHLTDWPMEFVGELDKKEAEIIEFMAEVRKVVTLGLEARAKAGIKVRQPLKSLKAKSLKLKGKDEYAGLIKDEVNVKDVIFDESLTVEVELDTEMTTELKEEGMIRDLIRSIQEMRKEKKLNPEDTVLLSLTSDEKGLSLVKKFENDIKKTAGLKDIDYDGGAEEKEIAIEDLRFFLEIK